MTAAGLRCAELLRLGVAWVFTVPYPHAMTVCRLGTPLLRSAFSRAAGPAVLPTSRKALRLGLQLLAPAPAPMSDGESSDEDDGGRAGLDASAAERVAMQCATDPQCEVTLGELTFSSRFCSGNMARAEADEDEEDEYNVWTTPDCANSEWATTCRSWFHFAVRGGRQGQTIGITVMNSNVQNKLYKRGYKPVVSALVSSPKWRPVSSKVTTNIDDEDYQIHWRHTFAAEEEVRFAFCYPHSFAESEAKIVECERLLAHSPALAEKIYFHREVLTRSTQVCARRACCVRAPCICRSATRTMMHCAIRGLYARVGLSWAQIQLRWPRTLTQQPRVGAVGAADVLAHAELTAGDEPAHRASDRGAVPGAR
jgi:hypothetical protein